MEHYKRYPENDAPGIYQLTVIYRFHNGHPPRVSIYTFSGLHLVAVFKETVVGKYFADPKVSSSCTLEFKLTLADEIKN